MKKYISKTSCSKKHYFSDPKPKNFYMSPEYEMARRIRSSERWRKIREVAMNKAQGMCLYCYKHPASEVHHIEEVHKKPELAYDINNLIPLCEKCHGWMSTRNKRGEDTKSILFERRMAHGWE